MDQQRARQQRQMATPLPNRARYLLHLLHRYATLSPSHTAKEALQALQTWFYVAYMMRYDPPAPPQGKPHLVVLSGCSPNFYYPLQQYKDSNILLTTRNGQRTYSRDGYVYISTLFLIENPNTANTFYVTDFLFRPFNNAAAVWTEYGQYRIVIGRPRNQAPMILNYNQPSQLAPPNTVPGPPAVYHQLKPGDRQADLFSRYVHDLKIATRVNSNSAFISSDGRRLLFEEQRRAYAIAVYKRGAIPFPVLQQV